MTMSSGILKGHRPGNRTARRCRSTSALRSCRSAIAISASTTREHRCHRKLRAAIANQGRTSAAGVRAAHRDLTHLSRESEFGTLQRVISELSLGFYVPGARRPRGRRATYRQRFGGGTLGAGWQS